MAKRKVEVFSAGCPACDETVAAVKAAACPSCDLVMHDMNDAGVAARAKAHGVGRVPAVVINGKLADCCSSGAVDLTTLKRLGLGVA